MPRGSSTTVCETCGVSFKRINSQLKKSVFHYCSSPCFGLAISTHRHSTGGSITPEYRCWSGIHARCYNKKTCAYRLYGGRGIKVCERWHSFENFLADMGPRPSIAHSIDRIDPDGDYEPKNCRWATLIEQARNKRTNKIVTFNGESLPISVWAERLGIRTDTLWRRFNSGWPVEKALSQPLGVTRAKCQVCGDPAKGHGYCSRHYQQIRKHGWIVRP